MILFMQLILRRLRLKNLRTRCSSAGRTGVGVAAVAVFHSPISSIAPAPAGVTEYDKGIIALYFVFLIAIGLQFRRLSKDTSDCFRCGGAMQWWITGTSP